MEMYLAPVTQKLANELMDNLKEKYNDDKTFTLENVVHLAVVRLHKSEIVTK
jgi:hypothetical protein